MKKVAIIGAGISGLSAAKELSSHAEVEIFEKSRGVGGRMSTRYASEHFFNHGAPFFTARDKSFRELIKTAREEGVVEEWKPKVVSLDPSGESFKRLWFEPHYRAIPKMNSLCSWLSQDRRIHFQTRVGSVQRVEGCFYLFATDRNLLGQFDALISTAPPQQSIEIVGSEFHLLHLIKQAEMSPCFALMLGYDSTVNVSWEAAVVHNSPFSWITHQRFPSGSTFVAHVTEEFSRAHLEDDTEELGQLLETQLALHVQQQLPNPSYRSLHRWLYARNSKSIGVDFLLDEESLIGCCGDWCSGGGVEEAFLSGQRLGVRLRELL